MRTAKQIADSTFLDAWTLENIKAEARRLRSETGNHIFILNHLLGDIEWLEECVFLRSSTEPEITSRDIAAAGLRVGLRWAAIQSLIEHPKGSGKPEGEEWQFIRLAFKANPNRQRKEIIEDGLQRFKAATGKASSRAVGDFIAHFKKRMRKKNSPKASKVKQ